jgi:hypothetical protein
VRPEVLVPIHTEQPEWWTENLQGTGIRVTLPELGRLVQVGE